MKNIHIEHLKFRIGAKEILHGITADLPADRFVALLGPNGCGKSTLLKHLYRVHRVQEGQVTMDGTPIAEIPLRAAAQEIGVMGQFHAVDFDFTVEEIALMGRAPYKESFEEDTEEDLALVRAALERVGMADAAQRSFNELSGGEQQRVMLARCLVQEPQRDRHQRRAGRCHADLKAADRARQLQEYLRCTKGREHQRRAEGLCRLSRHQRRLARPRHGGRQEGQLGSPHGQRR